MRNAQFNATGSIQDGDLFATPGKVRGDFKCSFTRELSGTANWSATDSIFK